MREGGNGFGEEGVRTYSIWREEGESWTARKEMEEELHKTSIQKEIMKKEMGEKRREREGKTVLSNVTFSGRDAEMHGQCDISPR